MNRILVIDDEKDIRTALKQILELEGYEVDLATNGRDGLAKLEKHGADLVITDVIMPGVDGIATAKQIREKYRDTGAHP